MIPNYEIFSVQPETELVHAIVELLGPYLVGRNTGKFCENFRKFHFLVTHATYDSQNLHFFRSDKRIRFFE